MFFPWGGYHAHPDPLTINETGATLVYTRAQLEEDLRELEEDRHTMRQLLLNRVINGLEYKAFADKADEYERKLHNKLFMTRKTLQDRDNAKRAASKQSHMDAHAKFHTMKLIERSKQRGQEYTPQSDAPPRTGEHDS